MGSIMLIMLGAITVGPTIYYFSNSNKNSLLNNYKEYIERFGNQLEENEVITDDGYILSLWHLIPNFQVDLEKVIFWTE